MSFRSRQSTALVALALCAVIVVTYYLHGSASTTFGRDQNAQQQLIPINLSTTFGRDQNAQQQMIPINLCKVEKAPHGFYRRFAGANGKAAARDNRYTPLRNLTRTEAVWRGTTYRTTNVCGRRGLFWLLLDRDQDGNVLEQCVNNTWRTPLDAIFAEQVFAESKYIFPPIETYSTEFMLEDFTERAKQVEEDAIFILIGQITSNIGHYLRDVFWLSGVVQRLNRKHPGIHVNIVTHKHADFRDMKYVGPQHKNHKSVRHEKGWKEFEIREGNSGLGVARFARFFLDIALEGINFTVVDGHEMDLRCVGTVLQKRQDGLSTEPAAATQFKERVYERCGTERENRTFAPIVGLHENRKRIENIGQFAPIRPVDMGSLTPCQQVQSAFDASAFVSVHGADLANLVWMRPGTTVVEIHGSSLASSINKNAVLNAEEEFCPQWKDRKNSGRLPAPHTFVGPHRKVSPDNEAFVFRFVEAATRAHFKPPCKPDTLQPPSDFLPQRGYYDAWTRPLGMKYAGIGIPGWDTASDLNVSTDKINEVRVAAAL